MDVRDLVRAHYGDGGLDDAIVDVLAEAGVDTDHITVKDLASLDQLHAGGAAATALLLEKMQLAPRMSLLDVGSGLGGPSRMAAEEYDVQVTGVDLTLEFVNAANALTTRVGLQDRVRFLTTSGETLPFEDESFDAAMMIHVGMNIPDKSSVFREVHRVLSHRSVFGLYEQVRRDPGQLGYPLPWAEDERSSFVETADAYVQALAVAGFRDIQVHDRTGPVPGTDPPDALLNPSAILRSKYIKGVGNHISATKAGLLGGVLVLGRA